MQKLCDYRKYKLIIVVLLVILAFSVIFNIYFICGNKNDDSSIIGTYMYGDEKNGEYLVFQDNERYILYKQFDIISEGSYSSEDNLYELKENDVSKNKAIICDDTIYYINNDGNVKAYQRISEVPMLINIKENQ